MTTDLAKHFLLDPEVVFLNHGSFGACPRPVFEEYQRWQRLLERQPVAFLDSRRALSSNLALARAALAAEVGAPEDCLAQVINATTGLNIALQSLPLKPGDEILTTDHEYSALEKTLLFITRRTGARIVVVEVPLPLTSADAFEAALLAGMTARTRVLFLSHITSPTALLFPLERLIAEARARGIFSVIDGAHAPGHIPLDLEALGADIYSGNCHKWMMAPKGSAFLYVRAEWHAMIDPLVISHGWTADDKIAGARGPLGASAFVDAVEMQGTRDPSAWLAVPAALDFRRAHDWWRVGAACGRLAQETAGRLRDRFGLPPLSSPAFSAPQMVAIPLPPCDPQAVKEALWQDHRIEIPVFAWQGRAIARLSCQGYNSADDMDILVKALGDLLAGEQHSRGARAGGGAGGRA